jgi:hypothetical protein
MLCREYVGLLACAALPLLGGCVQATRHSNTMVFGTTTTVGVKVGRDVNQMPNLFIAYDRQEAVIMPLLANTGEKPGSENMLTPCAPATEITTETVTKNGSVTKTTQKIDDEISFGSDGTASVHPCKFVGLRSGPNEFLIQDSYSVLASFGAKLKGNGTDGTGAAGLAQYFATGAAAQTLALNGGAAVIAVGEAAKAAAENESNAANAAAALGGDPVLSASGKAFETEWGKLLSAVSNENDGAKRASIVDAAVSRTTMDASTAASIKAECTAMKSKENCLRELAESVALFNTPKFFNK